jgi:hypothetical protein
MSGIVAVSTFQTRLLAIAIVRKRRGVIGRQFLRLLDLPFAPRELLLVTALGIVSITRASPLYASFA